MRIAYFDCFAGISGEMMLGALLSAGLSPDALRAMLSTLHAGEYSLEIEAVTRAGLGATCFRVVTRTIPGGRTGRAPNGNGNGKPNGHGNATYTNGRANGQGHSANAPVPDLEHIITSSTLPDIIKSTTFAVLRKLSDAEAAVYHSRTPYPSHASSREALVTIVAVAAGLLLLNIDRVECSPLQVGSGFVRGPDGFRPALSPVTAEVLRAASVPVVGSPASHEFVTPVGAALITTVCSAFGPMPALKIGAVGYGAGAEDLEDAPNLVRLIVGDALSKHESTTAQGRTNRPVPAARRNAEHELFDEQDADIEPIQIGAAARPHPQPQPAQAADELITLTVEGHQHSGRQRTERQSA
ncbi:MAG TPA: nickel insertion protein [Chloroflexia bacterium]|nr:nickel insertion protein [Chloroflexia bacterium]